LKSRGGVQYGVDATSVPDEPMPSPPESTNTRTARRMRLCTGSCFAVVLQSALTVGALAAGGGAQGPAASEMNLEQTVTRFLEDSGSVLAGLPQPDGRRDQDHRGVRPVRPRQEFALSRGLWIL
jgi:hypothetical protein